MEDYKRFKNNWETKLQQMFWDRFKKRDQNLNLFYFFKFGTLKSEVRLDKNANLYLCFIYEKRKKDDVKLQNNWNSNEKKLFDIFEKNFKENCNQKYIGFSKFSKNEDVRDVLWAIFLLGNENDIENKDIVEFLMNEKVKANYENFTSKKLNSDDALDCYISEIIYEFEDIAFKIKNEIFDVEIFRKFIYNMVDNMPFLKRNN